MATKKNEYIVYCNECEHSGDLEFFADGLKSIGCEIVSASMMQHEYEMGVVRVRHTASMLDLMSMVRTNDRLQGLCAVVQERVR